MTENKTSYRSIFKATSIFGGVQLFNIVVTLIRGKTVALLIGTTGMGLNGLYLSIINLITSICNMGLDFSAVRELADKVQKEDLEEANKVYSVIKIWIWISAILAASITIIFASILSKSTFKSNEYTGSIMWLSLTFIFSALAGGVALVLRALRKTKQLAQVTMLGSALGLLFSLPILYFYRIDGIVPSIIFGSFVSFIISLYFKKYVQLKYVKTSFKEAVSIGKPMVTQGMYVSISAYFSTASAFLLSIFITSYGTVSDLGLFNAAGSILSGIVGLLFSAIATDYFPRLSNVISTEDEWKKVVNQQAELLLIILPLFLISLVIFNNFIIDLLLSKEFRAINVFLIISVFSIPFKGITWVTGFIFSAKQNNKTMVLTELFANIFNVVFSIIFYVLFSFKGLAFATVLLYILSSSSNLYILRKYNFKLSNNVKLLLFLNLGILIILTTIKIYTTGWIYYTSSFIIFCVSFIYLLNELNKKIDFINFIKSKI